MSMKHLPFRQVFIFVLAISLFGGLVSGQSCPTGIISYWKLQESSGATFKDSYGNHDAVAGTSSPTQTTGISGKGQLFDKNTSSYITVADHSSFDWGGNANFSIELWVKFTEAGVITVFIGRDDPSTLTQWWIGHNETGQLEWYLQASDGSIGDMVTSVSYNNGQWHHVVAVRDGSQGKNYLYIDGIPQNMNVSLTGTLASTANISIGCLIYNDSPDYFFTGSLDEIATYNRILTPAEITSHYNNARLYQIGYCDGDSPILLSSPSIYATVGQQYRYDVDASGNSSPVYSLLEKPTGMAIDQTSGLITWTPSSANQNGHVVVKATNDKGSVEQSFNIFIAEAPACRSNLLAYWNFDESGSTPYADNIAGYKLNGAGANHSSGLVNNGLSFDGVNDSLNLKDNAEPSLIFFDFDNIPSFSFEVWMKSSATPSTTMVLIGRNQVGNHTQYWVGVNPDGTVGFYLSDYPPVNSTAYIEGGSTLNGAWHHIVATYNATTNDMKLFVDKTMVAETNQNFSNFGGISDLNIGYLNTPIDKFWYQGLMDEVAVYSTALTDAQIASNYNDAIAGNGACKFNFAPVILTSPDTVVNQGSSYSYKIIATEINKNDVTTISVVAKPTWLNFTYTASDTFAILSGIPGNADVGLNNVTLRVSDGSINVDQTFKIRVVNVNDAPVITSSPVITTNEDATYSYTVLATDGDNDALTFTAPEKPAWLTLDPVTHVLSGIPTNEDVGVFNITVNVSDGTLSADQNFQLTVNNVNDLPVFNSEPVLTVHANEAYLYECTATDVDEGDVLTFTADSKPSWLTFAAGSSSGILMGMPTEADMGSHAVILKVNDGHGEVLQGFTVTVSGPSGVNDIDNSIINNVYPNPSSDIVYFKFALTGKSRIEIYNLTGNLVKELSADNQKILEINISDLSQGIYLYKAYLNNKLSIGKITKK